MYTFSSISTYYLQYIVAPSYFSFDYLQITMAHLGLIFGKTQWAHLSGRKSMWVLSWDPSPFFPSNHSHYFVWRFFWCYLSSLRWNSCHGVKPFICRSSLRLCPEPQQQICGHLHRKLSWLNIMLLQFVIASLSGWGLLIFGGYKFFTKGKGKEEEVILCTLQPDHHLYLFEYDLP